MSMNVYPFAFSAMGSPCSFQIKIDSLWQAEHAASIAVAEIERIEQKFSRYRPDSVLSEINRHALTGNASEIDAETTALLDFAAACYTKSNGLFDITSGILRKVWDFSGGNPPDKALLNSVLEKVGFEKLGWTDGQISFSITGMELDFGGIAKEYAADRAAELIKAEGIESALVNLGVDLSIFSSEDKGEGWNIGIQDPARSDNLLNTWIVAGGGMATSGDYIQFIDIDGVRHGHILNPQTGSPVSGLASVTTLASTCMVAGAAATIALLKGQEGLVWLENANLPYLALDHSGKQFQRLPPKWPIGCKDLNVEAVQILC